VSVNSDAAVMVRLTLMFAFRLPEVLLTVMLTVPVAALLVALSVRVLVVAVLVGLNEAVTPVGSPDAESVTLPEKPPAGTTVIVLWPLPPCCTLTLAGDAESVKLGGGGWDPGEEPPQPTAISDDNRTASDNAQLCTVVSMRTPSDILSTRSMIFLIAGCTSGAGSRIRPRR